MNMKILMVVLSLSFFFVGCRVSVEQIDDCVQKCEVNEGLRFIDKVLFDAGRCWCQNGAKF